MKPIAKHLLFLVLSLAINSVSADSAPYSLLQVEDGDTLLLDVDGNPTRVQLQGIDAPEDVANPKLIRDVERTGKSTELLLGLGQQATQHLNQLIGTATQIEITGNLKITDKYGRVPVFASLPGAKYSLNAAMVSQGYAIALPGDQSVIDTTENLQQLELRARGENAGLWQSNPELMQAWSGRATDTQ